MLILAASGQFLPVAELGPRATNVAAHAEASARYLAVLSEFLTDPDSRFLNDSWQQRREAASRGMIW